MLIVAEPRGVVEAGEDAVQRSVKKERLVECMGFCYNTDRVIRR